MSTPQLVPQINRSLFARSFAFVSLWQYLPEIPNEHKTENFNLTRPCNFTVHNGNFGNFLQYSLRMRFMYGFMHGNGVCVLDACVCIDVIGCYLSHNCSSLFVIYISHSIGFLCSSTNEASENEHAMLLIR